MQEFALSTPRQGRMYDEDLESVIVSDKRMAQHSPILVLVKCPLSGFEVYNTFEAE
jgi:hypothetical protein